MKNLDNPRERHSSPCASICFMMKKTCFPVKDVVLRSFKRVATLEKTEEDDDKQKINNHLPLSHCKSSLGEKIIDVTESMQRIWQ